MLPTARSVPVQLTRAVEIAERTAFLSLLKWGALLGSVTLIVTAATRRPTIAFGESKNDVGTMVVKKYAYAAYPQWAVNHPDRACPSSLAELNEYIGTKDSLDPWGNPYELYCDPRGHAGVLLHSRGEDGVSRTEDDIWSTPAHMPRSLETIAAATARKYTYEAFPAWVASHPDETCPHSLADLHPWMDTRDDNDPWGHPYELYCTPDGMRILVHSRGADATTNTDDDIWSP